MTRILLAQHFEGWTLAYIDTLSQQDVSDVFAILNAQDKARPKPKGKT